MIAAAKKPESESEHVAAQENSGLRVMVNQEQLLRIVPVSPVTLWRMEKKGQFPKGTFISPNKKIWYLDEIIHWQDEIYGRGRGRRHHPARSKPPKS
jgi:predicted DNA-binding transcriptional regulator AlpA